MTIATPNTGRQQWVLPAGFAFSDVQRVTRSRCESQRTLPPGQFPCVCADPIRTADHWMRMQEELRPGTKHGWCIIWCKGAIDPILMRPPSGGKSQFEAAAGRGSGPSSTTLFQSVQEGEAWHAGGSEPGVGCRRVGDGRWLGTLHRRRRPPVARRSGIGAWPLADDEMGAGVRRPSDLAGCADSAAPKN